MSERPGTMVEVHFNDSVGTDGWTDDADTAALPGQMAMWACGYLVAHDEASVTIAAGRGAFDKWLDPMVIPRPAIIDIREVGHDR